MSALGRVAARIALLALCCAPTPVVACSKYGLPGGTQVFGFVDVAQSASTVVLARVVEWAPPDRWGSVAWAEVEVLEHLLGEAPRGRRIRLPGNGGVGCGPEARRFLIGTSWLLALGHDRSIFAPLWETRTDEEALPPDVELRQPLSDGSVRADRDGSFELRQRYIHVNRYLTPRGVVSEPPDAPPPSPPLRVRWGELRRFFEALPPPPADVRERRARIDADHASGVARMHAELAHRQPRTP